MDQDQHGKCIRDVGKMKFKFFNKAQIEHWIAFLILFLIVAIVIIAWQTGLFSKIGDYIASIRGTQIK